MEDVAKVGRPKGSGSKKTPQNITAILQLTREGKTREEIGKIINVSPKTIWEWKNEDWEFSRSLKENAELATDLVEMATFKRATGYSHPETKVFCTEKGIFEHEVTKYYPPDTEAAKFWLSNKRGAYWKVRREEEHKVLLVKQEIAAKMSNEELTEQTKILLKEIEKQKAVEGVFVEPKS